MLVVVARITSSFPGRARGISAMLRSAAPGVPTGSGVSGRAEGVGPIAAFGGALGAHATASAQAALHSGR